MKTKSSTSKVTPGFEGFSAEKSEIDLSNTARETNNRGKSKTAFMSKINRPQYNKDTLPREAYEGLELATTTLSEVRQPVVNSHRAVAALKLVEPILYSSNDLIGIQDEVGIHIAENKGFWPEGSHTPIQIEEYSLAAALIQHATGQYEDKKSGVEESETTTHNVQQNLKIVLEKLDELPVSETPRIAKIISFIAELLPSAHIDPHIISKNEDDIWGKKLLLHNNKTSIRLKQHDVLLIKDNGRYQAVIAASDAIADAVQNDSVEMQSQLYLRSQHQHARDVLKNIAHATNRLVDNPIKSSFSKKELVLSAEDRLAAQLLKLNIEKIDNSAPQDINFISGVLRHATGIYRRENLSEVGTRFVLTDEELHSAEAYFVLSELMIEDKNKNKLSIKLSPLGNPKDSRTQFVIRKINEIYNINLHVTICEPTKDGSLPILDREMPNDSKRISVLMLREGNCFNPVRMISSPANKLLQPEIRQSRKSSWGKAKALLADFRSPARRRARKLSDAQLISKTASPLVLTTLDAALRKELKKRTATTDTLHGQKTLAECIKTKLKIYKFINSSDFSGESLNELELRLSQHRRHTSNGGLYTDEGLAALRLALYKKKITEAQDEDNIKLKQSSLAPITGIGDIETFRAKFLRIRDAVSNLKTTAGVDETNPICQWGENGTAISIDRELNLFYFRLQTGFDRNSEVMIADAVMGSASISMLLDDYKNSMLPNTATYSVLNSIETRLREAIDSIQAIAMDHLKSVDIKFSEPGLMELYLEQGFTQTDSSLLVGLNMRITKNTLLRGNILRTLRQCAHILELEDESNLTYETIRRSVDSHQRVENNGILKKSREVEMVHEELENLKNMMNFHETECTKINVLMDLKSAKTGIWQAEKSDAVGKAIREKKLADSLAARDTLFEGA